MIGNVTHQVQEPPWPARVRQLGPAVLAQLRVVVPVLTLYAGLLAGLWLVLHAIYPAGDFPANLFTLPALVIAVAILSALAYWSCRQYAAERRALVEQMRDAYPDFFAARQARREVFMQAGTSNADSGGEWEFGGAAGVARVVEVGHPALETDGNRFRRFKRALQAVTATFYQIQEPELVKAALHEIEEAEAEIRAAAEAGGTTGDSLR
ncbi:MAG: hypothetical protein ACRDI2_00950 [Chloroflexota bacterium]